MISGMRDQVLALACLRHGLPAREGRGMDGLPADVAAVAPDMIRTSANCFIGYLSRDLTSFMSRAGGRYSWLQVDVRRVSTRDTWLHPIDP